MQFSMIIAAIDLEITRMKRARSLLAGEKELIGINKRKTTSATKGVRTPAQLKKKRNLTPEGRQRISDAVRRRWKLQKSSF